MNHLRRVLRTLLELGNQKRTILPSQNPSFHLSSPDEWSGCPLTRKPSFYVFVSLSFLTHSNPNQNYHPERKSPAEERNPLRSHSSRNWTRSKPDEKDERPLPSGPGLLVFLSQLRSGSHNQPSFCVFLLFSLIFNIRCLFMQSYKQNNNNKSSKIRKSITEIRKEKKEDYTGREGEVEKHRQNTERDQQSPLFATQ